MSEYQERVLNDIRDERRKQDEKWEKTTAEIDLVMMDLVMMDLVMMAVLTEEVGEVARALLEQDSEEYYRELIQVAAVATAMAEEIMAVGD